MRGLESFRCLVNSGSQSLDNAYRCQKTTTLEQQVKRSQEKRGEKKKKKKRGKNEQKNKIKKRGGGGGRRKKIKRGKIRTKKKKKKEEEERKIEVGPSSWSATDPSLLRHTHHSAHTQYTQLCDAHNNIRDKFQGGSPRGGKVVSLGGAVCCCELRLSQSIYVGQERVGRLLLLCFVSQPSLCTTVTVQRPRI